jgi:hypothetical protein
VPAEQGVRRDDRRDLAPRLTAQPVRSRHQFPPLVIGEPGAPATHLPPQEPILFNEVRQHLPLAPVQPAGDSSSNMWKAEMSITCGSLHHTSDRAWPTTSAETWDTAGLDLQPLRISNLELVNQNNASWNRLQEWLHQIEWLKVSHQHLAPCCVLT